MSLNEKEMVTVSSACWVCGKAHLKQVKKKNVYRSSSSLWSFECSVCNVGWAVNRQDVEVLDGK